MKKIPWTILVVDDDPSMIRLMEKKLTVGGYNVVSAASGNSGLQNAIQKVPDLILLDVMMPDMSGVDVVKGLKKNTVTKDIPIIFMTVCIDLKDDKGHERIEIDGSSYQAFAKPLHHAKLLSTIRKTINRRENKNDPV